MQALALASPLYICGGVKITYDVLLYANFRRLRPPEEARRKAARGEGTVQPT